MMRLTLPLPPNSLNLRRSWRVAQKEKKAYWERLKMWAACGRIAKPPRTPFDPAEVSAIVYGWNIQDVDNLMGRLKPLMDWLKAWGYIQDDSPRHLKWRGIPEQVIDRKNPRIVVDLETA